MDNWENEIDSKDEVDMDLLNELRNGEFKLKDFCRILPKKKKKLYFQISNSIPTETSSPIQFWTGQTTGLRFWFGKTFSQR
jgi:hypothetical protein